MKNSKSFKALLAAGLFAAFGSAQAMEISAEEVDLNKDGKVTEAEIINVIKMHFMSMDKDGNESVSMAEWKDHAKK